MYKIKYVSNFSDEMFVRDVASFMTIDQVMLILKRKKFSSGPGFDHWYPSLRAGFLPTEPPRGTPWT